MMLVSCSSTALGPVLVLSKVSVVSVHITAVSISKMPMELIGLEGLDFNIAQYAGKVPVLVLSSPRTPGLR